MKYAFIDANRRLWPVSLLCEQLEISASGYHQHSVRKADLRPDKSVRRTSRPSMPKSKANTAGPVARGICVGKERVRKLMAQHGIRARTKRKFKATTD